MRIACGAHAQHSTDTRVSVGTQSENGTGWFDSGGCPLRNLESPSEGSRQRPCPQAWRLLGELDSMTCCCTICAGS